MHQKCLKILGFLVCAAVIQASVNASIIVSYKDITVNNGPTTFEVYASANAGTQLVGGYGFILAINNSPTGLAATQVVPVAVSVGTTDTKWSGLFRPVGGPVISGNTVKFQGGGPPTGGLNLDPYNVSIGTGQSTNTLLGTVSFVSNFGTVYTISSSLTSTLRTDLIGNGDGFLSVVNAPDGLGGVASPVGSSFNAFAITAVPEPSTMALVGLAIGGFGLKRFRSRRKR